MNEKQKLFTRHSIGTRIAALFMLLILVITGVMTYVSISVSTSELLDSSTDYTEQLILRVNAELDMYVEYMKDISDFIVDNGAVAAYLQAANEHRLTDAACRGAQQQLAAAQKIRAEITSIALIPQSGGALFGSEGASLNTYSNYHTADWYVDALADPDEVQVSSSRVENLIAGQYNWVVSFSKAVLDAAGQVQGVLLIDLNYQIIDRLCADIQLGSRGYIYLIDQSGGILWHPQQDLIYAGLKEENAQQVLAAKNGRMLLGKGSGRKLYVACASEATGWTAVGVAYTQELPGAVGLLFSFTVSEKLALPSMVPPLLPASQVTVRLTVAPQSSHLPSPLESTWSAYSSLEALQTEQVFVRLCCASSAFVHEP